jgi:hypothetical protein
VKLLKLSLVSLVLLAVTAPAFAICGYCDIDGVTCVPTPNSPCRIVKVVDGSYCENAGFCRPTVTQVATVTEEWTIASVETNGVVTKSDAAVRTASLQQHPSARQAVSR